MSQLLELVADFLRTFAEKYLPAVSRLIRSTLDWKAFTFSWVAHYSRQFGMQAILTTGVVASLYAGFQFSTRALSPETPKPSHDVILKSRFSSPAPSAQIVIIDIDERTLALLSQKHGRWPWSRDVLADGLQKLSDLQARAILFNVLLSDPDKNHPDADAAMDITAQLIRPVAFPLIRLAPQNDKDSKLRVAQIPGARLTHAQEQERTIAAILPMFGSMHDRLGVGNQKPDADGIVRKYPIHWKESGFVLPSVVGRTLEISNVALEGLPDSLSLNWRNKKGRYSRISFGDLVNDALSDTERQQLQDAYVVLGVSAPGIGQTKATGVSALEDDSEILATALDDVLNDTHLRMMPQWLVLLINLAIIWGVVWVTTHNVISAMANKAFVVAQSALGGVTLLSASYTPYLIDLSDSMTFGMAVFGVIKLVQSLDDRWSRAKPGFRKIRRSHGQHLVLALGWLQDRLSFTQVQRLQRRIEQEVGMPQVARIDDLFGGDSFVKGQCSQFQCLLVHIRQDELDRLQGLLQSEPYTALRIKRHDLQTQWDTESKIFVAEVAPLVLEVGAELLRDLWTETSAN